MDENRRSSLIFQAEESYLILLNQIAFLLDSAEFYIQRYPVTNDSEEIKHRELITTANLLAGHIKILGKSIVDLKLDQPRKIHKIDLQLDVMNEIWAGSQALLFFLISNQICVENFNLEKAASAFKSLCASNKALP